MGKALDIVDTLVKSAAVDMVVVDSVAALVPKAELEGEMGDHHIALQVGATTNMGVGVPVGLIFVCKTASLMNTRYYP